MNSLFYRQYKPLETTSDLEKEEEEPTGSKYSPSLVSKLVIAICVAFLAGVLSGPYLVEHSIYRSYDLSGQIGNTIETWFLNKTFAGKPDTTTEAAWRSIIPDGRGFVTLLEPAPVNKSVSVFHQLHCLHALRVAYFKSLHEVEKAKNSSYTDPFMENIELAGSPEHMQHCFDYIRQALMCAADTNLENVDPHDHVTTGWGIERKCRNYWDVVRWAEKWKNNDDHDIL